MTNTARTLAVCLILAAAAGCISPPGTYQLQVVPQANGGPQEYMLDTSTGTLYRLGTYGWKRATVRDFDEGD